jgi:hypothetical protein
MADEQATKKKTSKKKKKQAGTEKKEQRPSTALVESPSSAEAAADRLERTLDTITANQLTVGTLTLSYPSRDVVLILDGLTAAKVLAAFADPARRPRLQDHIDTATSSMQNLWASFDLGQLLAVSWMPGLPTPALSRMTVDPPNPHSSGTAAPTTGPAVGG